MEAAHSLKTTELRAIGEIQYANQDFLGVPVTPASLLDTVAMADQSMRQRHHVRHVCINVAKFVAMRTDASLDHDVRSSDIISIDGKGILWAARLFGLALPGRVAGIDLMDSLLKLCADKGYRPYFLGATKDILAKAIERIQASYPQIQFAGWQDGYYSADKEAAVVENIRLSRADCLFVAMPTPKKEQFIANHHSELHVPFIMGVGGSLDVVAGFVRRAPKWVQELGLEWLYRTIQEPRRLAPRYFKTNAAFAWIMIRWMFDKHLMSYRLTRR